MWGLSVGEAITILHGNNSYSSSNYGRFIQTFHFWSHAIHSSQFTWRKSWRAETVEAQIDDDKSHSAALYIKNDILTLSFMHRLNASVCHKVSRAVPQCTTSWKWWATRESFKSESTKFHIDNKMLKPQLPRSLKIWVQFECRLWFWN